MHSLQIHVSCGAMHSLMNLVIRLVTTQTHCLAPTFSKTASASVVRCGGIAYLSGLGKHKLSLASNPAAAVSQIIMVNYSQYIAFMESRHSFVHIIVIN